MSEPCRNCQRLIEYHAPDAAPGWWTHVHSGKYHCDSNDRTMTAEPYSDHEKAAVLRELCEELAELDWFRVVGSGDDSRVFQIDGAISMSEFAAGMIVALMPGQDPLPAKD